MAYQRKVSCTCCKVATEPVNFHVKMLKNFRFRQVSPSSPKIQVSDPDFEMLRLVLRDLSSKVPIFVCKRNKIISSGNFAHLMVLNQRRVMGSICHTLRQKRHCLQKPGLEKHSTYSESTTYGNKIEFFSNKSISKDIVIVFEEHNNLNQRMYMTDDR